MSNYPKRKDCPTKCPTCPNICRYESKRCNDCYAKWRRENSDRFSLLKKPMASDRKERRAEVWRMVDKKNADARASGDV